MHVRGLVSACLHLVAEVFKDFFVELRAMDGSIIWNTIALTKFACSQMVLVALRLYNTVLPSPVLNNML